MMQKIVPILFFICFGWSIGIGQKTTSTDSLVQLLNTNLADSSKLNIYVKIYTKLAHTNPNKAILYIIKANLIAQETGDAKSLAKTYYYLGKGYLKLDSFQLAENKFQLSYHYASKNQDTLRLAYAISGIATCYKKQGFLQQALSMYLKALKKFEFLKRKKNIAWIQNTIGNIYKTQLLYDKALEYYQSALTIVKDGGSLPAISACLNNIGSIYQITKKYDSAFVVLAKALAIKRKINDKKGEIIALMNLGNVSRELKKYAASTKYFQQSLQLSKNLNRNEYIIKNQYNLGYNALVQKKYSLSVFYAKLVLKNKKPNKGFHLKMLNHALLSEAYAGLKNFEKAHYYAMITNDYQDSLFNVSKIKISKDLEAKYQFEKKKREIDTLKAIKKINALKIKAQETERMYIIGIAIIGIIAGIVFWSRYKIKVKSNTALEQLDLAKSRFFANISHELRTPLTLILNPIQNLLKKEKDADKQNMFTIMERNGLRMQRMVNQLLDIAKAESGKLTLHTSKIEIHSFLKPIIACYHSLSKSQNIPIHFVPDKKDIHVYFDVEKLETVLHNILSNAFNASKKGDSITIKTDVEKRTRKNYLTIKISDTGTGIPQKDIHKIFDRFQKLDENDSGTGIGLAHSLELIKLHHGEITVQSDFGQGSTFTILLPLRSKHLARTEIVSESGRADVMRKTDSPLSTTEAISTKTIPENFLKNQPTILIVEDNKDMLFFIAQILNTKYQTILSENGLQGFEMAKEKQPDLILSDVMMPEIDGIELCRRLKEEVITSHIPVILLTAKTGKEYKMEGWATGADDYLPKPFDADELLIRIENRIKQREIMRKRFSKEINIKPKDISNTSADERFLVKVIQIIDQNMSDFDFNVQRLLREIYLGRSQLENKLKALTNQTPVAFIRLLRLKKAAEKITNKEDTVSQIAYSVGFNNLSYFSKCFKAQFGKLPSEY